MKKIILTIAVVFATVFSANAQLKIQGGMTLGGYAKNDNFTAAPSFMARAMYDFDLGGACIGIGAGFLSNNSKVLNDNGNFVTSWIQIPVAVSYYYQLGKGSFYSSAGLYYGRALSGKVKSGSTTLEVINNEIAAINIIKPNDFGYLAQVGYITPINLGIYVGYNGGFLNIAAQSSSSARNSIAEIGLMYRF